ncbi:MAG TPA: gas vesicle protein [Ktedonobacterales bacterium]
MTTPNTENAGNTGNISNSGYSGYAGQPLSPSRASGGSRQVASSSGTTNLADLLERVLDKGIVIAGDITVSLGQVELLSIKVRLLVASIDKAQEIGIDWWRSDPALSSHAKQMETQNDQLKSRLDRIEDHLKAISAPQPPTQAPGTPGTPGIPGTPGDAGANGAAHGQ